ncbi:MAG: SOS response-associated peptidase family protein, partial [Rhizobiales bacterium]|nr:SOS response-associated peptidase family protein [Hyphomicrobiales bacterium]
MCGRFTKMYTWEQLHRLYMLTHEATWKSGNPAARSNLQPRYNICPTTQIDIIRDMNGRPEILAARWGLIPSWWKKPLKELPATFNARAETVAEKPMFRAAFKSRRCI